MGFGYTRRPEYNEGERIFQASGLLPHVAGRHLPGWSVGCERGSDIGSEDKYSVSLDER